jgi:hypothetical protein
MVAEHERVRRTDSFAPLSLTPLCLPALYLRPCVVQGRMTDQEATRAPDWPICGAGGCVGVRVEGHEDCLARMGSGLAR